MALILAKMLNFVGAIGDHFIAGPAAMDPADYMTFVLRSDYEWEFTNNAWPSVKANMLGAAIADILLWGAILVDQMVQTMVVPSAVPHSMLP